MKQAMTPEEIKEKKPYLDWSLTEAEYDYIRTRLLGRLPNYTETGLFSAMWSEHCSYKKSKPVLRLFPNKNERVLQGPGEGAGVVDIDDGQAVVFKAESHNHPTTVEPYQGAATGVGGILRDIFSMGARPIASLDSLHFGELDNSTTRMKVTNTVRGIGDYGNCMGIPTIAGETTFDPCYQGNILCNAMSVGLMDQKDIQQGRAAGIGNAVMYVGAKTGRDGIHGATFASADFNDENMTQRSAVQVGNPFMEKLLLEACLDLIRNHPDWLVGIQDMGAAGIVSSSAEMASEGESGMELNLDLVPQREPGMSAYEIMLSESQERMLLCVKKGYEEDVKKIFDFYDLEVVTIGRITAGHDYVLFHDGEEVCHIPVSSLTDDVLEESLEKKPVRIELAEQQPAWIPDIDNVAEVLTALLAQSTIADKSSLYQQYDSQVRTNTVAGPGSDAGVLRIRGTHKGLAMTTDGNGRFVYLSPEVGGQIALVEAAANIIASGAEPLAITDCLNYGDPTDPEIFWELHQSVQGMADACREFNTPVISGNVSLYNENNGQAIHPTPMVGMVGLIKNIDRVIPSFVQHPGDKVYLVGQTRDDYAGSELQKMMTGDISGIVKAFDLHHVHQYMRQLLMTMENGLVSSAHDLSEGGLGVALAETVFKTDLGLKIDLADQPVAHLFSETPGRFIVTVAPEKATEFEQALGKDAHLIGEVTNSHWLMVKLANGELNESVAKLQKTWKEAIPCQLKSKD